MVYTFPKIMDFPRQSTKYSGENEIQYYEEYFV